MKHDQREVVFHVDYSCGTAAVRGSQIMGEDQYYWEVKMTTPVYGTDMVNRKFINTIVKWFVSSEFTSSINHV